jgi:hypothetical protein
VIARIVRIQEIRLEVNLADAVVSPAVGTNCEPPSRLAVLSQAVCAAVLVGCEISGYAVFCASLAMLAKTLGRVAARAIFVSVSDIIQTLARSIGNCRDDLHRYTPLPE